MMRKYIQIILLSLFVFTGCATKIDFEKYDLKEYVETKDIEYKKKPNLLLENITVHSSRRALINTDDFIQSMKFNEYYYELFDPSNKDTSSNITLNLMLDEFNYYVEYIAPREYIYKDEVRYTDDYYNIIIYSHIKAKLTKADGSIEIFDNEVQNSYRKNIDYFYGWRDVYLPKYAYQDTLDENIANILTMTRNRLINPFTVIKILEEIKAEKGKSKKYAISINGGICDGIYSGQSATILNKDDAVIGYGEVTSQSTCKQAWILMEKVYSSPVPYDKVIIKF
jgi:hypothetical protein